MNFEQLLALLEPIVAKEIKKLVKVAMPLVLLAQAQDETSRAMIAKLLYKMACYSTAQVLKVNSCPDKIKALYRKYLCQLLKLTSF